MKYFIDYNVYKKYHTNKNFLGIWLKVIEFSMKKNLIDCSYLSIDKRTVYVLAYKDGFEVNVTRLYDRYKDVL